MAVLGTTDISTTKVRNALGESSNDVGTLCKSNKINMWSKWKPIKLKKISGITINDLETVNFGLIPPTYPDRTKYKDIVDKNWVYEKPTGGAASPYRLGDFSNYNDNAGAIAQVRKDFSVNKSDVSTFLMNLSLNLSGSDYMIGLSDFISEVGNYYYGAIFEFGNVVYIKSATKTIANHGNMFEVILSEAPFTPTPLEPVKVYNILMSKSVPNMVSYNSIPPPFYTAIPSEVGITNITNITVETGVVSKFAIIAKQIGTSPTNVTTDIGMYMEIDAPYYTTTGALYIQFDLVNSLDTQQTLNHTGLEMNANPNYFGINNERYFAELRDVNGSTITSIVVPANTTKQVIIGFPSLLNRDGGNIADPGLNKEISSTIILTKNGYVIATIPHLKLKSS